MPYLTPAGLQKLKDYKYASGMYGFLDRVIMTPFWNALVPLFPMWLAPNLMTLIGLLFAFLAFALVQTFAFYEEGPSWVYFASAACFFAYQTLDALDGKQARRTNSSSPLGQLFDHGCDSICAILSGFVVCAALQSGPTWFSVAVMYNHMLPFFSSNWECAHTDHMRFGVIGVTEAQFVIIGILVITGIQGTAVWRVLVFGYELRHIMLLASLVVAIVHTIESIRIVNELYRSRNVEPTEAHQQLYQFGIMVVLTLALFLSPSPHYWRSHEDFTMLLLVTGLVFSYLVTRLIVCHVTDMQFERWHMILSPLPFLVLNSYLRFFIGPNILCEPILLAAYLIVVVLMYLHFIWSAIDEISTALNIKVFTIDPAASKPKSS